MYVLYSLYLWAYLDVILPSQRSPSGKQHGDNGPHGAVVALRMVMAVGMLTISTSQSLREKQALWDSADVAGKTDPQKGKALCVHVCTCERGRDSLY